MTATYTHRQRVMLSALAVLLAMGLISALLLTLRYWAVSRLANPDLESWSGQVIAWSFALAIPLAVTVPLAALFTVCSGIGLTALVVTDVRERKKPIWDNYFICGIFTLFGVAAIILQFPPVAAVVALPLAALAALLGLCWLVASIVILCQRRS